MRKKPKIKPADETELRPIAKPADNVRGYPVPRRKWSDQRGSSGN